MMNREKICLAAAAFMLLVIFTTPSAAQRMTSNNYSTVIIVNEFGGYLNSSSYKMDMSATSIKGVSNSTMYKACIGYLCIQFGPAGTIMSVAFVMDMSIGGVSGDQAAADTKSTGLYRSTDLSNYFTCIEDPSLADNPVVGIIAAGDKLRYLRIDNGTSYTMRVAEDQPGNKFIIPITSGGCAVISNKFPLTLPLTPFIPGADEALGAMELAINYPIEIVGDFEETGKFRLVLEKSDTGIIGRPG